jgi:hypothetical protein
MKRSLAILTAALGLTISAQGNVGDTLAESNQRYGQCLPWEGIPAEAIQDLVSQGSFFSCDWSWRDRKGGIIREWFDKDHVHCNLIDYPISIDEARRLIALNLGTQVTWERDARGVVAPNAVQRIKGISSTGHVDQAGSGTGKFLRSLAKTSQR